MTKRFAHYCPNCGWSAEIEVLACAPRCGYGCRPLRGGTGIRYVSWSDPDETPQAMEILAHNARQRGAIPRDDEATTAVRDLGNRIGLSTILRLYPV